ncbi:MAG: LysM peptidoglycan-binding domain-containing protein [Bdellovibrionota bacterium]
MKKYSWVLLAMMTGLSFHVRAQDDFSTSDAGEEEMLAPDAPEAEDVAPRTFNTAENQIYMIRQGDTMWDICKITLDNPWYWPKLWSLNQYILNPNLIYPGNRLVFSPATDTSFEI